MLVPHRCQPLHCACQRRRLRLETAPAAGHSCLSSSVTLCTWAAQDLCSRRITLRCLTKIVKFTYQKVWRTNRWVFRRRKFYTPLENSREFQEAKRIHKFLSPLPATVATPRGTNLYLDNRSKSVPRAQQHPKESRALDCRRRDQCHDTNIDIGGPILDKLWR
jgi:hypothetical protein